ncbi:MAG: VWA domain-containing protein [Pirellulales bacterium]|nr:VWA domain-containing protein [Pirellulales bacterium]
MFLLALGITNLAMLGWLAAAAIPVVIHLLSRRRYREMPWAAVEHLLAALRASRRRIRFEQWLLLVVRMLIVVLIVLAVAEPHGRGGGFLSAPAGARTHRVIVLDGSYSMAFKPGETSRFDQAKALARRIVEDSPRGDAFSLVLMTEPARAVVAAPALEPGELLREIDNLALPDTSADLAGALARVEEILAAARREQPGLDRAEVYFLTDLCRVGWTAEPDSAAGRAVRDRAGRIAQQAALVVIDLGQAEAENRAVASVQTDRAPATVGETVTIHAVLRNFGRQDRPGQDVELLVDERRAAHKTLDLPADASRTVVFSHRFDAPGPHLVEIRLAADALDVDNHRWLALEVKDDIRALVVDGRPSGRAIEGAAGYLAVALAPSADRKTGPAIQPEVVPESALVERDLGRYDAVFLADVAQFTAGEARLLDNFVRGGGGLAIFLGPRVLADRYRRELGGKDGLLPAELGAVVERPGGRLDPLGYRHPIVRPFRGQERAGLLTTPVDKYVKLDVPAGSDATVVLATSSGDPLVVERPWGLGRVVLVATSADRSWTPMPLWPSYVPLVQEILAFAIGGRQAAENVLVGQAIAGEAPGAGPVSIRTPRGKNETIQPSQEGLTAVWRFSDTTASGPYVARFETPTVSNQLRAVNVDTVESDLTKLNESALRGEVWPGAPLAYQTTWTDSPTTRPATIARRSSLARPLLYAVLALLVIETLLARRFGRAGAEANSNDQVSMTKE